MERHYEASRTDQLANGLAGPFAHPPAGSKSLHRHLFQDLYAWAGQVRSVEMHRRDAREDGSERSSSYLAARLVEQGLHSTFDLLKHVLPPLRAEAPKEWEQRNVRAVAEVAASHVGGVNYVHAFRDGNRRTMRRRVESLARDAGLHP